MTPHISSDTTETSSLREERGSWRQLNTPPYLDATLRVLGSGFYTEGPETEALEAALGSAVAVSSGTAALALSLAALSELEGRRFERVLIPAATFVATALAVDAIGAQPIFYDTDPDTFEPIDPKIASEADAMVLVDIDGFEAPLPDWFGGPLVRDSCAASTSAPWVSVSDESMKSGVVDAIALSFNESKISGVGEGGAVLASNRDLLDIVRSLRRFGWDEARRTVRRCAAGNWKMTELTAALACVAIAETARRYHAAGRDRFAAEVAARPEGTVLGGHQSGYACPYRIAVLASEARDRLVVDHPAYDQFPGARRIWQHRLITRRNSPPWLGA